jgi:type II secretory pathway component PulF
MPTFAYKAKKSSAETVSGQISAQTRDEAIDLINQLGFLPISVEQEAMQAVRPQKVKSKDIYVFSRQLANLLKSGVSLLRALSVIETQTKHAYFHQVVVNITNQVKNGRSFSEALSSHPHVFSSLYLSMVRAGEETGNLYDMLVSLSLHQQKQEEIFSKVRTALVYPCLMAFVGFSTILFILMFVLPKMSGLFTTLGSALPLPTAILLATSQFLRKGWMFSALILLSIIYLGYRIKHSKRGQALFSQLILKFPLFGPVILKSELARFARTLSLLLKSGVSLVRSLQIAIPLVENNLLKKQLLVCSEGLLTGKSLSEGFRQAHAIPSMMQQLISVGEESGNLIDVLDELANSYEEETSERIKIMTTLLEPVMILSVGLIIGFMVFAMLLPIFQIDVLAK